MSLRLGPPSLFNLSVDHICGESQELPDFAGFPECVVQQIMLRILARERPSAALQLLHQPDVLSSLEVPISMAVDDQWLEAIGKQAGSLEELRIADCSQVTAEGMLHLQHLSRLVCLHLYQLPVLGNVVAQLVGSMPQLKELHLEGPQGGSVELDDALCTSLGSLKGLEQLALVGATGLNAHKCSQVAKGLEQLYYVDMSGSDIEDNALICLIRPLQKLKSISLKGCSMLTDGCAQALSALPQLQALDLARTSVGDLGLSLLKTLDKLQRLSLCGTKVTDTSIRVINTSMKALTELDLSCKRVTDLGLQQLSNLSKLTTLNLSYTQVSDQGMMALRKLPKLSNLSLRWTRISDWALGTLTNSAEAEAALVTKPSLAACQSASPQSLSLTRGSSSETLPFRRSRSSLDAMSPAALRRCEQQRRRGLSRSGDYSQVLRRCRAVMDFNSTAIDDAEMCGDDTGAPARISEGSENHETESEQPQSSTSAVSLAAINDTAPTMHNPSLELLSCRSSRCVVDMDTIDDDGSWLNDSLSAFEIDQQEGCVFRGFEPGDFDSGLFTTDLVETPEDLDFDSLESPTFRCAEPMEGFEMEPLDISLDTCCNNTIVESQQPDIACKPEAGSFQEMRTLDLSVTDIADAGLGFLSAFSKITCLNLFSTKVTDDGLEHVAKLSNLTQLDLCGTEVSDAGLGRLVGLTCLEILKLSGNQRITDDGVLQVITAIKALRCLELRSTSVSSECLEQVADILNLRSQILMA